MHSFAPEITLITILTIVIIAETIGGKLKIPSVFLLLIGSFLVYTEFSQAIPLDLASNFSTIILFCIPLIFMGDALHLKFSDIKKHSWSIFYLAVISVALSITIGASLYYFDIFSGLSIGAYVSLFAINMATDAVSVQSVLSRFDGIKHDIKVLIEGESLGNDATAVIAFFFIGLPWMLEGKISAFGATVDALKVFSISIALGLALGYMFYMIMKLYSDKRGEFFTFIVEAYSAYVLAEEFHISGILTLIVAIISTKAWIDNDLEASSKSKSFLYKLRLGNVISTTQSRLEYIYEMASELGYIATVVIFFVLAEMVNLEKLWEYKKEILIMFAVTTIIRALMMAKFSIFGSKSSKFTNVGIEGWFILTFSGMKGALSIILVHMIPDSFEHKEMFESVTIGVVVLSIFVYGIILWAYFTFFKPKKEVKLFN